MRDKKLVEDSEESSSSGSESSNDLGSEDLSFETYVKNENDKKGKILEQTDDHVLSGMGLGTEFQKDPIKTISMLGALIARQDDMIQELAKELKKVKDKKVISTSYLLSTLEPIKTNVEENVTSIDRIRASLERFKKRHSDAKLRASTIQAVSKNVENVIVDRLTDMLEEFENLQSKELDEEVTEKLERVELKILALEGGASSRPGLFPVTPITPDLIPEVVRTNMASLEFKIALLESRVGAETLRFGNVTLKSLVDTKLFVNDRVPSCLYGCFLTWLLFWIV